ncbi:MAG TPA: hypothetical protein VKA18_02810 [Alphaproteobacteria bacterium]|nr:hypothetical protein [Alphaproteobacteria bacterium]
MLEFRPENFRHACESGDDEAQLYAFWTHSREGLAAARAGDAVTVESCRRALEAMVDFFEGHPVARQASVAIQRMEAALVERLTGNLPEADDTHRYSDGWSA